MTQENGAHRSVLLLTDKLIVGGLEQIVVRLAHELLKRGYRVGVAAAPNGELWGYLPNECARHYLTDTPGLRGWIKNLYILRQLINKTDYGIVHSHQRGVSLSARIAALGKSTIVVEHVHNVFLPVTRKLSSFRGHVLIACGAQIAAMLQNEYGRPSHRIHTALNGVPDLRTSSVLHRTSGAGETIRIIAVGRVCPQKNPEKFIALVQKLNDLGADVQAEWVGGGELLDSCRETVASLGIRNLRFSGPTSDTAAKLSSSDLLVLTSRWEGLPLVVLEAMSLGLGAVVPDVGSCREAVSTGINGIVYPPEMELADLASLVARELTHDQLDMWGRASRGLYEEKFSLERFVDDVELIYAHAVQNHGLRNE